MLGPWIVVAVLALVLIGCVVLLSRRSSRGPSGSHAERHAAQAAASTRSVHTGPGLMGGGGS